MPRSAPDNPRFFFRRREAAQALACSESQLLKWERQGVIVSITVPGIRAKRITADELKRVADAIANGRLAPASDERAS